jgi:LysM repeat protein
MKKIFFLVVISVFSKIVDAQDMTVAEYVAQYKNIAIREMKRMGVPAAISLAQGILETENGNSDLVKKSNNHFGIKCKSTWTAETVSHDDDAPGECFRAYKTAEDSYRDHSNFLRGSSRYSFLFKLDPRDYKSWAYGLSKAGYATNPKYPEILIKNIEDNNLEQYTLEGINDIPVFDASQYSGDTQDKNQVQVLTTTPQDASDIAITEPAKLSINGCKVVFAPKGTSLLAIATQNNINLSRLLEINDLHIDGLLDKDQYIFVEKKQKLGDKDYYIVQQNESLYDIAQKNGVILQSLYDYNNISLADNIYPGTKIFLRPPLMKVVSNKFNSGNNSDLQTPTSPRELKTHEVQPRESLYAIAKKYNVSVTQLKELNNLKGNSLKTGQLLIISK